MKLFIVLLFISMPAFANSYIGLDIGRGSTGENTAHLYNTAYMEAQQSTFSSTASVYAGYRFQNYSIEGGFQKLPSYSGYAHTDNYPLYKGLPAGTYPLTATINQTIKAKSAYVRGSWFASSGKTSPYLFTGIAYTITHNHEWGNYNGTDMVEYSDVTKAVSPVFGIGMQRIFDSYIWRVEAFSIKKATNSYHTDIRDVHIAHVGVARLF